MASAQRRSGTRGRPPPKRWVLSRTGMSGSRTAHNASETRKAVVVRLLSVPACAWLMLFRSCVEVYRVIRIGSKLDFVHFQPNTSDDILAADSIRESGEFLLRDYLHM